MKKNRERLALRLQIPDTIVVSTLSNIREQFPTLQQDVDGNPLVYLDSAATSLMPSSVLAAMEAFEASARANVHRGMHVLAERATDQYEQARVAVQKFLNAHRKEEIVFTKNCTEALNLVAKSMHLEAGNTIAISTLEHHSNMVPWQQVAEEKGCTVVWFDPMHDDVPTANVVAVTGLSNVLGSKPDLQNIIASAHNQGAVVVVDAAQLAPHQQIDVQELDCDFLAFSGHKLYGPTGIGVLYGKREHLQAMQPFLGGGSMIENVTTEGFTSAEIPQKFEAGTPPITQAIGLRAAIDWLNQWSWEERIAHEQELEEYAYKKLQEVDALTLLSPEPSPCLSFTLGNLHPHDVTDIIGKHGVCLRAGHHCAQPLHEKLNVNATIRLSIGLFNTKEDINLCAAALAEVYDRIGL